MQVASYTYQSPSSSAVQVGRLDPLSVKEEPKKKSESNSLDTTTPVQKEAQSLAATQTSEVTPSVESERLLDVYA
jgi:hypothetical protein